MIDPKQPGQRRRQQGQHPELEAMIVRTDHSRPQLQPLVHRSGATAGIRLPPASLRLRTSSAFTLLELLTVITIMGIIAALAVPTLRGLKPNAKVAATRELLDAVGRARQLAISQRTTVYMVFLSTNFWSDPLPDCLDTQRLERGDESAATSSSSGTPMSALRSVGDQPGVHTPRYLSSWRTLPQGAYIPPEKFCAGASRSAYRTRPCGNAVIPPFQRDQQHPVPLGDNPP